MTMNVAIKDSPEFINKNKYSIRWGQIFKY